MNALRCRERFVPKATARVIRCERWRGHRGGHVAHVREPLHLVAYDCTIDMSGWTIHLDSPMTVGGQNVHFIGGNFVGHTVSTRGSKLHRRVHELMAALAGESRAIEELAVTMKKMSETVARMNAVVGARHEPGPVHLNVKRPYRPSHYPPH